MSIAVEGVTRYTIEYLNRKVRGRWTVYAARYTIHDDSGKQVAHGLLRQSGGQLVSASQKVTPAIAADATDMVPRFDITADPRRASFDDESDSDTASIYCIAELAAVATTSSIAATTLATFTYYASLCAVDVGETAWAVWNQVIWSSLPSPESTYDDCKSAASWYLRISPANAAAAAAASALTACVVLHTPIILPLLPPDGSGGGGGGGDEGRRMPVGGKRATMMPMATGPHSTLGQQAFAPQTRTYIQSNRRFCRSTLTRRRRGNRDSSYLFGTALQDSNPCRGRMAPRYLCVTTRWCAADSTRLRIKHATLANIWRFFPTRSSPSRSFPASPLNWFKKQLVPMDRLLSMDMTAPERGRYATEWPVF